MIILILPLRRKSDLFVYILGLDIFKTRYYIGSLQMLDVNVVI